MFLVKYGSNSLISLDSLDIRDVTFRQNTSIIYVQQESNAILISIENNREQIIDRVEIKVSSSAAAQEIAETVATYLFNENWEVI